MSRYSVAVSMAGLGSVLVLSLGCLFGGGGAPDDLGACEDFLACAESVGQVTETMRVTYGEDGLCWEEEDEALCMAQCADNLTNLAEAHPDDPICVEGAGIDPDAPPACLDDLEPTGSRVGDVLEDIETIDDLGDPVRLHAACDRAVLVMSSLHWDEVGREAIGALNDRRDRFDEDELFIVAIIEMDERVTPSRYADETGAEIPVWEDPDGVFFDRLERDNIIPSYHLLAPGMVLERWDDGLPSDAEIEAVLP